jgi:hypothetical protein
MHRCQNPSYQELLRARGEHKARDILESKFLLLELGCSEPTLQLCFKVIESTCLSQGIGCLINGRPCLERFQAHLNLHYVPFVKESLRAMVMFGFVPWRVRRLSSGDWVPEVLPGGTFDWNTEVGPNEEMRRRGQSNHFQGFHSSGHTSFNTSTNTPTQNSPHFRGCDDDTRLVVYKVTPTAGSLRQEDVHVYIHTPPCLDVSSNSILTATVPSPLAHVLTDYKNLRCAQIRRSYADSWNTTAQFISTFKPNLVNQDEPSQSLLDFVHESYFDVPHVAHNPFPALEARNWFERDALLRKHMERPTTHRPMVYTLPRDHDLTPQVMLSPCEDLPFLLEKFRRDLAAATGVPYEMVAGRQGAQETATKTMTSGRLFTSCMNDYCRHCQRLLSQVYAIIYRVSPDDVEFNLTPMPRLEVETIADLKTLFEIGALTPDMSFELSRVLLGNTARPTPTGSERRRIHEGLVNKGGEGTDKTNNDKTKTKSDEAPIKDKDAPEKKKSRRDA